MGRGHVVGLLLVLKDDGVCVGVVESDAVMDHGGVHTGAQCVCGEMVPH